VFALTAFVKWLLDRRHRPEFAFQWQIADSGCAKDLKPWPAAPPQDFELNKPVIVEVAVCNVGDATASEICWNMKVPDCFTLSSIHNTDATVLTSSGDTDVSFPPLYGISYISNDTSVAPGNWVLTRFKIELSRPPKPRTDGTPGWFAFEISEPRLNSTGWRMFPTLVPKPPNVEDSAIGVSDHQESREGATNLRDTWPKWGLRRRVRWPRAAPRNDVACISGSRYVRREIRVTCGDTSK
jgi:hypothetical protein